MQKIGTPGAASQNWAFLACALRRTKPPVRREKTSSSESSDTGLSGGICCSVNGIDECKAPAWWFLRADLAGRACVRALQACLAWIAFWAGTQGKDAKKTTSALPALFFRIHAALHRNLNSRAFVAGKCNLGIWARTSMDEKAGCTGEARRWR